MRASRWLRIGALVLCAACQDFSLTALPTSPSRPSLARVEPKDFFAGQRVTLTGEHLGAAAKESAQIFVEGVAARLLEPAAVGGDGLERLTVAAPGGLAFDADLRWVVKTSAGDSQEPITGRYLGIGHLAEEGTPRRTGVGVDPFQLSAGAGVVMVLDLEWDERLLIVDAHTGELKQTRAFRVKLPDGRAKMPWVEDVVVLPSGTRAVVSYGVQSPAGGSSVSATGLVALALCEEGWRAVRHLQLDQSRPQTQGRLQRLALRPNGAGSILGVRTGGQGGIFEVPTSDLPDCSGSQPQRFPDEIPTPDSNWKLALVDDPLPSSEIDVDPGLSLSEDGNTVAVRRSLSAGSLVERYDLTKTPPLRTVLSFTGPDEETIRDVALIGAQATPRLALLRKRDPLLVYEKAVGDGFLGRIDLPAGTSWLHRGRFGELWASSPAGMFELDLDQERSLGSMAVGLVPRMVQDPARSAMAWVSVAMSDRESGRLVLVDRDARAVVARYSLDYPLATAGYVDAIDTMSALSPMANWLFGSSPGDPLAWLTLSHRTDYFSMGASTTTRLATALAGSMRNAQDDRLEAVEFLRSHVGDTSAQIVSSLYLTTGPGPVLGLEPWGDGAVALKSSGFELVGAGPGCEVADSGDLTRFLPTSCFVPFPSEVALPAGHETFAAAEGAGRVWVGQHRLELDGEGRPTSTLAVQLDASGALQARATVVEAAPASAEDAPSFWSTRALSSSRDGQVLAVVAASCSGTAVGDCDERKRSFFYLRAGDTAPLTMRFFNGYTGAVAASPDGTRIYVGTTDGMLYTLSVPQDRPIDSFRDVRVLATLGGSTEAVGALHVNPDGASLSIAMRYPSTAMLLVR